MIAISVDSWESWARSVYAPATVRMTLVAGRSLVELTGTGVEHADTDTADAWWRLLRRSSQTRASYLDGLRRFYSWRQTRTGVPDPTRYLRSPVVRRGLPRPVDASVVEHAMATAGQPVVTWLGLAAWAGLRRSEIARLRPENVWVDAGGGQELRITGKGGRTRVVPVPGRLATVLAGYPWPRVSDSTVYVRVRAALAAAGDEHGAPHRLRHSYATTVYGASADLLAVAQLLGHASVATTQVYAHVSPDHLRRVVSDTFTAGAVSVAP